MAFMILFKILSVHCLKEWLYCMTKGFFYHSNLKFSAISKERRRTASPSSSSPSRGLPSFRFSAADEELTEIIDELADGETEIENKLRIKLKVTETFLRTTEQI